MEEQDKVKPDEPTKRKDRWDKADIILKSVGSLLTALALASIGFLGSRSLEREQDRDTRFRLYTELMSRREEADSSLRKDMFNNIIKDFLKPASTELDQQVLNLELLAYNFHESLELGPLFKDVYQKITDARSLTGRERLLKRLRKVTAEVKDRQISALEWAGGRADGAVNPNELKDHPEGIKVIKDETITMYSNNVEPLAPPPQKQMKATVEVLDVNHERKELRIRLTVRGGQVTDVVFWAGFFSFPMLDNTRLPDGQRCAVVVRQFNESGGEISDAQITLVCFPGSRASLKEKPYYDEIIQGLKRGRESADQDIGK